MSSCRLQETGVRGIDKIDSHRPWDACAIIDDDHSAPLGPNVLRLIELFYRVKRISVFHDISPNG